MKVLLYCSRVHACLPVGFRASRLPRADVGLLSCGVVKFSNTTGRSNGGPVLACLGRDNTSVLYLRRCSAMRSSGRLSRGSMRQRLGTCPCRHVGAINDKGKRAGGVTYCSGFPVLSSHVLSCPDRCGNSMLCRVGVKRSAIALVGGRLRSGGLAGTSGIICRSVLGSPRGRGIGDNTHLLVHGLTRTSTVHTPRTSAVTRRVTTSPRPCVVMYNSFGSAPVSCARHAVTRSLSSTFARSKQKLNVSCGRGEFCFQVSGVLADGGLETCGYAMSHSVGRSSRCPV